MAHDYYNSEPEMITKLRTNPGGYDVVADQLRLEQHRLEAKA